MNSYSYIELEETEQDEYTCINGPNILPWGKLDQTERNKIHVAI